MGGSGCVGAGVDPDDAKLLAEFLTPAGECSGQLLCWAWLLQGECVQSARAVQHRSGALAAGEVFFWLAVIAHPGVLLHFRTKEPSVFAMYRAHSPLPFSGALEINIKPTH